MGIVILLFSLVALGFAIAAGVMIIYKILRKEFFFKEFLYGILLSALLFGILFADYMYSDSAYALGAYFIFPFVMVFIPFAFSLILSAFSNKVINIIRNALLVSAVAGAVFIVMFPDYTYNIVECYGLNKYY